MIETVKKALIAMSGGVDSSVAAILMKEKGYTPYGVTMLLHSEDTASTCGTHSCCTPNDIEDARLVSSYLGIPFSVVNYQDSFREEVIEKFISTYLSGETPNPCIDCNRYMKFGRLFQLADELGCEKVVTGHYARVEKDAETGEYKLKRAVDAAKDQTYVLYFLSQQQLSRLDFPDGDYTKPEIRQIADREGLVVADKHDSQDICFVPDGDYAGFMEREDTEGILAGPGDFISVDGKVLGQHKGYFHYTIGQRKGLGIAADRPLYVVDIDSKENVVILGDNADLFTDKVYAREFSLIAGDRIWGESDEIKLRVTAKVRYRSKDMPGEITIRKDGSAFIIFDEAVRAPAPGQSLVIYDGEYCLGGGIITGHNEMI